MIKRTILATIVALITASMIVLPAFAGSYYVSEQGSDFNYITLIYKSCPAGWTCRNGNAFYYFLRKNGGSFGTWWARQAGTTPREMDWWTFVPNNGSSQIFGAIRYRIVNGHNSPTENYPTVCNQNNWKGQAPYLGYLIRGNYTSYLDMQNYCVAGYSCNTSYPVFWDRSQFYW